MRRILLDIKRYRLSIRTRLLLLLACAIVPALAGFSWFIIREHEQARDAAYAQVRVVANNVATQINTLLSNSETTLERLAARPSVRALDPRHCDPIFQEQLLLRRESTVLGLRDLQGRLICTSSSNSNPLPNAQAAGMAWFRDGLAAKRFFASDAFLGPASGRWVSNLTYPVRDDAGRVTGLLFVGIDLLKLQEQLARSSPPGAHLALFDRQYKFLMRSIEPEKSIGTPLPEEQLAFIKDRDEAYFAARNILGASQLWALITMPETGWRVTIGLPEDAVMASSREDLRRSMVLGGIVLLLMTVLTWLISKPIRDLARTSAQLTAGDTFTRAALEGPAEIEAVAAHFNRLLDERERTLETLRKSEERFVLATRGSSDGFWDWDIVTGEDYFSERFCELLGYAPAELAPHVSTWQGLLAPEELESVLGGVQTHLDQRTPYDAEFRMRTKRGEYRWFRGRGQAVWNEAGQAIRMAGSITDITERKQIEEAMQVKDNAIATSINAIVIANVDGSIFYVNPTFIRMWGYQAASDIVGKTPADFAQDAAQAQAIVKDLLEQGSYTGSFTGRRKDATSFLTEIAGSAVKDKQGRVTHLMASFIDVTERSQAQEALRISSERLNEAQRVAHVGSWELDLVTGKLSWSNEIFRLFEIDQTKFDATYEAFLNAIHPEDRDAVNAAYSHSLGNRQPYEIKHRLRMADGRIKWVTERCESEFDAQGKPLRSVGTVQDISELMQAEEALRQLNAELEQRVEERTSELRRSLEQLRLAQTQMVQTEKMAALGGLVAGVAHEINTPLGIGVTAASHLEMKVQDLAQCLRSGALSRDGMESFIATATSSSEMVLSNLQRAAELIRSFKQVAVDQSSDQRRHFRLKAYLDEVLLSLSPQLGRTRHQIRIDCPSELQFFSHPGSYSQIVTNLVMNSLLHGFEGMEAGQIVIQVEDQSAEIVLRYSDNGRGIAPEHLAHIFEPFYTTKRGQGGSGLGLHIVYNIVTQGLGASIRCSSAPGQGVVFEMRIPWVSHDPQSHIATRPATL